MRNKSYSTISSFLLFFISHFCTQAQNSSPVLPLQIQKLENTLKKDLPGTERMRVYRDLADEYFFINAEASKSYATKALEYALSEKDEAIQLEMYCLLGKTQVITGHYMDGIISLDRAKELALPKRDTQLIHIHNGLGIAYQYFGEYDRAVTEFSNAINYANQLGLPHRALYPKGNLSDLFRQRGENETALDYMRESLALALASDEKRPLAYVYKDLSFHYINLGKIDSAKVLVEEAIRLSNKKFPYIAADAYVNLSIINRTEKDYNLALEHGKKASSLARQVNTAKFITRAEQAITDVLLETNRFEEALSNAEKNLEFVLTNNLTDETQNAYFLLERIYAKMGDYPKAYEIKTIIDSLKLVAFNRDRAKRTRIAEYLLKTKQKEEENKFLKEQIDVGEQLLRQSKTFNMAMGILCLIAILSLYYFFRQGNFRDPKLTGDFVINEEESRIQFIKQLSFIGSFLLMFQILHFYFGGNYVSAYITAGSLIVLIVNYYLATKRKVKMVFWLGICTFYPVIIFGSLYLGRVYSISLALIAAFLVFSYLTTRPYQQVINIILGISSWLFYQYHLNYGAIDPTKNVYGLEFTVGMVSLTIIIATVIYFSKNILDFKTKLWKSNQFLTQIANINPHFIFAKDVKRKFTFVNKAMADAYGMSPEQMIGKRDEEIHPFFTEDLHFVEDDIEILDTGKVKQHSEEKILDSNNREKWLTTIKKPILSDEEKIIGLLGVATDITEVKRQREVIFQQLQDLNNKNRELEKYIESNMELENFAYIASHDLRAPIRTIISFGQLLKRSLQDKLIEQEKDYLDFIMSASLNMNQLINDLLTYSRVNNSKLNIEPVDLPALLEQIMEEMHTSIKDRFAIITLHNLPPKIYGDHTKLKQLFQNLIGNSLKFSKTTMRPKIEIHATEKSKRWHFMIKDNGIGINKEFYDRIFLLFQRLHSQDKIEGTGIGLALCKKITEQHQGQIWVESREGIGTTFHFTISKKLTPTQVITVEPLKVQESKL